MNNIHDERETNKIGLSTYLEDLDLLNLDLITKDLIKELNKKSDDCYSEIYKNYIEEQYYHLEEAYFIEEQLKSILEMKIVHLYKGVEINTKKLIKAALEGNISQMHKWREIETFLESKNIGYKEINGFNEVNELRLVNNHIKHWTDGAKNRISHIPEFTEKELEPKNLISFYNRIKSYPIIWILGLRDSIYDYLYVFNDQRLDEMVKNIGLRMDYSTMNKFVNKLKNEY